MRQRSVGVFAAGVAIAWTGFTASAQRGAPPPAPVPPVLQNYRPVTSEQLIHPPDDEWLMVRRTYNGWGYSPLDQITPANVRRLQPVWIFSTGQTSGHESPPVVHDGVMFVSTPGNQVIALDAKTGLALWRFRSPLPEGTIMLHATNRGVAVYGDKVFLAGGQAVLYAIDAKTGREVWSTQVADNKLGYYMSLAPLVADGKVMVGASGGELGVRGFVAAFDPDTGREVWRVYTVPAPGEPGSETWPAGGNQWKTGGGPVWVTGNYDPDTNIAYWGVGNGGPWMADQRPGDNLYTSSTIAIDVGAGKIVGHFQYTPNESWDWDEVSPPLLIDYQRGGRTIKGLVDAARNGYLWFLERGDRGTISFVAGKPYVKQNVFTSLDPRSGRPTIDPDRKPGTGKRADFCPSLWGGKNWPPAAFSPKTRLFYIPANNNLCMTSVGREIEYVAGRGYTGASTTFSVAEGADHIGEVQAWNVDTGERVWTHTYSTSHNWGPLLATGGGLVFGGGTNDRKFHAFDASTGELLWDYPTNSGIVAPASTFTVDGVQYVAVQSGWGVDSASIQGRLNTVSPGDYPPVPEGGAIWVFAVK
jgi:alcohol dehydrogenase (cytochrome c)